MSAHPMLYDIPACVDCGNPFTAGAKNAKRCESCRVNVHVARRLAYQRANREKINEYTRRRRAEERAGLRVVKSIPRAAEVDFLPLESGRHVASECARCKAYSRCKVAVMQLVLLPCQVMSVEEVQRLPEDKLLAQYVPMEVEYVASDF